MQTGYKDHYSIPTGAEVFLLSKILENSSSGIVHICKNDYYAEKITSLLNCFFDHIEVIEFPAWDTGPYERTSPNISVISKRLTALAKIKNGLSKNQILITTANAFLTKIIPQSVIALATLKLKPKQEIKRDSLTKFLVENSYINVAAATESGEFAIRGSIIDVAPPNSDFGFRIDFFGDEIESIRKYDLLSQVTTGTTDEFDLLPATEVILNPKNIESFKQNYMKNFSLKAATADPLYEAISEGRRHNGAENLLPLFYEKLGSILDYTKGAVITFEQDIDQVIEERFETVKDAYETRKDAFKDGLVSNELQVLEPEELYISKPQYQEILKAGNVVKFHRSKKPEEKTGEEKDYKNIPNYYLRSQTEKRFVIDILKEDLAEKIIEGKGRVKNKNIIACITEGSKERIKHILSEQDVESIEITNFTKEQALITKNNIGLIILPIESGFEAEGIKLISEADIFGEKVYRKSRSSRKAEDFIKEAATLSTGELIVHKEHGIGRFLGLETLDVKGILHDFIKLEYHNGDKLYVPVENIDMLSRYGAENENAELDKLGGLNWQERTAKVKNRIKDLAFDLIKIAAERELRRAKSFESNTPLYDEFCERFKYTETEDQQNAIEKVLEDISSGRPMDRLICGDVGFGKTEVGLRAAFAVTQNNHELQNLRTSEPQNNLSEVPEFQNSGAPKSQVAVVCPTTLLCRQHFNTFSERFSGTGIQVKQLSRLVSSSESKKTKEQIKNGEVDIVVGTHALLAKNIEFKNLNLVIVDEEQRFGVAQKERLKKLREETHILTLTATPIPRTLQLSLAGVRELSLIATPPVDRLAVRTFITPYDEISVREAILKEHYRGGKTYFVVPRIKDIEENLDKLKKLIPEVKIVAAHGRMTPDELDGIMNDFYDGKFDVLMATTIVESGLDVPSANTIIIFKADMYGLAQLYQLRGRVGRGKTRAYAYLTTNPKKQLTKNALKRLEVMQKLDMLGAGFTLASYDMDIRGFGNLLGEEQSGNIREVGIELYQQMLKEEIEKLKISNDNKQQIQESDYSVKINLGVSVLLPESYVKDSDLRMGLYRRLGNLQSEEEIENFAVELVDRFGKFSSEVENLLNTIKIKLICRKLQIEKIDAGTTGAVISFKDNKFSKPEILIGLMSKNPTKYKIKENSKFVIANRNWEDLNTRTTELKTIISEIYKIFDEGNISKVA